MLVLDKRVPTTVPFKDIREGECFIDHDGELNIKLDVPYFGVTEESRFNAVVLDNGQPWRVDDEHQVIKVKAQTTIVS